MSPFEITMRFVNWNVNYLMKPQIIRCNIIVWFRLLCFSILCFNLCFCILIEKWRKLVVSYGTSTECYLRDITMSHSHRQTVDIVCKYWLYKIMFIFPCREIKAGGVFRHRMNPKYLNNCSNIVNDFLINLIEPFNINDKCYVVCTIIGICMFYNELFVNEKLLLYHKASHNPYSFPSQINNRDRIPFPFPTIL